MEPQDLPLDINEDIIGSVTSLKDIVDALAKRGCADLTSSLDLAACSENPLAGGGFCDVYQGALSNGTRIAIKSLKVYSLPIQGNNQEGKVLKRAARELYHWSKLKHPNVLSLMGLAVFKGLISMVSGWMGNGHLRSYLEQNPDANRIRLCMDICAGLCHIHGKGMVHGDLKGANVMISPSGIAMIADFGNAQLKDLTLNFSSTGSCGFSFRWAAPELISSPEPYVSMEADVYAYGMTALEALTSKVPYEGTQDMNVALLVVYQKKIPPRPESGIPDGLWELLQSCWAQDPSERPKIASVGERLEALFPPLSIQEVIGALARYGCLDLTSWINLAASSDRPSAGGLCGVYRGVLHDGTRIAIKPLKVYESLQLETDDARQKLLESVASELYHWSGLKHPNVLSLMGLAVFNGNISMISGWMENGDLMSYLKLKPDADRIRLCKDICTGLCYIHENGLVHGAIKAANIMISPDGVARIADLGDARFKDLTLRSTATAYGFSVRWTAPELLKSDASRASAKGDVYAYGMTVLEALTGKEPYFEASDAQVQHLVAIEKQIPSRPEIGISDGLWELLNSCWNQVPTERPNITDVGDRLEVLFPTPPPPEHTQTEQREGKDESESHPDVETEANRNATMSALASTQIIEDPNAEQTKEEDGGIQGGDLYWYIPDTDPDDIHARPIVIPPPPYEHIWKDIYSANIAAYRLRTAILDSKRVDDVLAITKTYPQAISARFMLHEYLTTIPTLAVSSPSSIVVNLSPPRSEFTSLPESRGSVDSEFPTTALNAAHANLKEAFLLYSEQFNLRKEYLGRALVTPNSGYGYPKPGGFGRPGVAGQDSGPGREVMLVTGGEEIEDEAMSNEDSLLCLVEDVDGACDALGEHADLCRMLRFQVKGLLKFLIQRDPEEMEMDWPPPPGSVPSLGEAVIRTILVQLSQIVPTDSSARIADAIGQMSANLVEFARSQDFEIYIGISPSPIDPFPPHDRDINISYSPPPTPPMNVNLNVNEEYSKDGSERAHSHPNSTFNQPAAPAFPAPDAPPKTYTPIPRPSNPAPVLSPTSTASPAYSPTKMYVNPNRLAGVPGPHSPYSGEGGVAQSVSVANPAPGSSNPAAAAVMRKTEVLDDPNGLDELAGRGFDAVDSFMQVLRQDVATGHPDSQRFREALIYLWELTGHYPAERDIMNEVSRMSRTAVVQDAISFTHHAVWLGIQPVLVRYLRATESPSRIRRRLRRDIDTWRKLFHPNIHPFCSVVLPRHGAFGLVMPHVQSGDVIRFLIDHPNSDRTRFVLEAAEGLRYLHDEAKLVHGDFRGVNLLVSGDGRILVTGYGVMTAIEKNQEFGFPQWSVRWGDARWMAPELHHYLNSTTEFPGVRTLQSDVYAFGCTALEIWTGMAPFAGESDSNVVLQVAIKGRHPPRPAVPLISKSCTDQVWALLRACWNIKPAVRPSIRSILEDLRVFAG